MLCVVSSKEDMRSPRLYQLSVLLAVLLSYQWRAVNGSYYPIYGQASSVFYNGQSLFVSIGSVHAVRLF